MNTDKLDLVCPACKSTEKQKKNGKNRSGTQSYFCNLCRKSYTLDPKPHEYTYATRRQAYDLYNSGVSGREIGKLLNISKANVYNWIKKYGKKD